jgi:hypothetical protein
MTSDNEHLTAEEAAAEAEDEFIRKGIASDTDTIPLDLDSPDLEWPRIIDPDVHEPCASCTHERQRHKLGGGACAECECKLFGPSTHPIALTELLNAAKARADERAGRGLGSLYEIGDDMMALDCLLTEMGGDVTSEEAELLIDAWLQSTAEDEKIKVDRYVRLMRELDGRGNMRAAEARRLADLATTDKVAHAALERRLHAHMQRTGQTELQVPSALIKVVKNGGKQAIEWSITDAEKLPPQWRTAEVVTVYKKKTEEVYAALIKGATLAFAKLLPRGTRLVIK